MASINRILSVEYEFPAFFGAIARLSRGDAYRVMRNLIAGMNGAALEVQRQWMSYASGEPIPGTIRRMHGTGEYARSIKVDLSRDFEKRIFTDSPNAGIIENGHGEIDLKKGLLHGPKARLSKGRPTSKGYKLGWASTAPGRFPHAYNIVAFRHGTKKTAQNPMPKNIDSEIRRMFRTARQMNLEAASSIIGGRRGAMVVHPYSGHIRYLNLYQWGVRAHEGMFSKEANEGENAPRTSKAGYAWKGGKFTGMVRFGNAKQGRYLTMRTVSTLSDPKSWRVPPIAPLPIRQVVVDKLRRKKTFEHFIMNSMLNDLGMGGAKEKTK